MSKKCIDKIEIGEMVVFYVGNRGISLCHKLIVVAKKEVYGKMSPIIGYNFPLNNTVNYHTADFGWKDVTTNYCLPINETFADITVVRIIKKNRKMSNVSNG